MFSHKLSLEVFSPFIFMMSVGSIIMPLFKLSTSVTCVFSHFFMISITRVYHIYFSEEPTFVDVFYCVFKRLTLQLCFCIILSVLSILLYIFILCFITMQHASLFLAFLNLKSILLQQLSSASLCCETF